MARAPDPATQAQDQMPPVGPTDAAMGLPPIAQHAMDPETYYLVPNIEAEIEAAVAWQVKNAPNVYEENVRGDLPLDRLTRRAVVYVLCRKPQRGKNGGKLRQSEPIVETIDGQHVQGKLTPEDLAQDFQDYGPISCKDCWENGDRSFLSKLDRAKFLDQLGTLASPWALAWKDGNARKGGELPSILQLRYT